MSSSGETSDGQVVHLFPIAASCAAACLLNSSRSNRAAPSESKETADMNTLPSNVVYPVGGASHAVGGASLSVGGTTLSVGGASYTVAGASHSIAGARRGASHSVGGAGQTVSGASHAVGGASHGVGGASRGVGGASHLVGGASSLSQPQSSSVPSSQQFTVEEQITTVHIPMRRPNSSFLEIVQEGGARGEVFTMKEIVHHVKNYIIKHQLFDVRDPRVVHCGGDKLGRVFNVHKFTIEQAVPLFLKNTYAVPDSCIRIRRQLVKRAVDPTASTLDGGSTSASAVSSTLNEEGGRTAEGTAREESAAAGQRQTPSVPPHQQDAPQPSGSRHTSVNIEYADEVDGATPVVQVNLETRDQSPQRPSYQTPEEDSFSVQYDSDQFAVEYEVEPNAHPSESDHSSHNSGKADYLIVQRESDVEFWADYSDTESGSDAEFGDADHWLCKTCQTRNIPFYRNCSKCWSVRPNWLPEHPAPSPTHPPLPAEPCGSRHGYQASSGSNDELQPSSQGSLWRWKVGDRVRRRRIRVVSASSDRNSESLVSMSEDEAPTTALDESRTGSASELLSSQGGASQVASLSQEGPSSQEVNPKVASSQEANPKGPSSQEINPKGPSSQEVGMSQGSVSQSDKRGPGGGKWKKERGAVAASSDSCVVCLCRPKTGCIIHGSSGHQVCCYRCAKSLKWKRQPCPVCRRPIQKVIRNFVL